MDHFPCSLMWMTFILPMTFIHFSFSMDELSSLLSFFSTHPRWINFLPSSLSSHPRWMNFHPSSVDDFILLISFVSGTRSSCKRFEPIAEKRKAEKSYQIRKCKAILSTVLEISLNFLRKSYVFLENSCLAKNFRFFNSFENS